MYRTTRTGLILIIGLCAGLAIAGPQTSERNLGEEEIRDLTSGKTSIIPFAVNHAAMSSIMMMAVSHGVCPTESACTAFGS